MTKRPPIGGLTCGERQNLMGDAAFGDFLLNASHAVSCSFFAPSRRVRHRPEPGGGTGREFVDTADLAKLAVTETALFPATVHDPLPKHGPPLQPTNVEPTAGTAMSVTTVDAG